MKQFNNFYEALEYADKTGDMESLADYQCQRAQEAVGRIMKIIQGPIADDDMCFFIAAAEAVIDGIKASFDDFHIGLTKMIKDDIHLTIVGMVSPPPPEDESEVPNEK